MNAQVITQLISSLGFPIVTCFGLGYYIMKKTDKMIDILNEIKTELAVDKAKEE